MTYDMESNTKEAEILIAHVEAIREHSKAIIKYCTEECTGCPMRGFCNWDRDIDYEDEGATSIDRMVDYLEYYDRIERRTEAENQRRLDEAWDKANKFAGIDPTWALLPSKTKL